MLDINSVLGHRWELGLLCNDLKLKQAVEIGTHQGVFASGFLEHFKGKLTCVDPWEDESPPPFPVFQPGFIELPWGRGFDEQLAKLILTYRFGDRVSFIKGTSTKAAERFDDLSTGFVYIDGLHSIPHVKEDILTWWPKVKSGGILAGHDYVHAGFSETDPTTVGVSAVVNWFAVENNLELHLTMKDEVASWYMRKA